MLTEQYPRYFFHSQGSAFSGTISKPFHAVIESQAATALGSIGGHAFASSGPFNLKEMIRFDRASTQIAGSEEEESYDTVGTCAIEGINIFNQFTADLIVAHYSVKAAEDGTQTFSSLGSRFVNLRIGGAPVEVVLEHEYDDNYGATKAPKIYDPYTGKPVKQNLKNPQGYATTLVKELKVDSPNIKVAGNTVYVPDFGVVYLAEYLVQPYARHTTMFRIELGCAGRGCVDGGNIGGNGIPIPPRPG